MFRSTPAAAVRWWRCSDFRRRRKKRRNEHPRRTGERSRAAAGHHHHLRDGRLGDADAGFDHRQRGAAVHAGLAVGLARPGQLGADLLHRRRRDHDRAGRLDGGALRPQAAVRDLHRDVHDRLDPVRPVAGSDPAGDLPPAAGRRRRRADPAVAIAGHRSLSRA